METGYYLELLTRETIKLLGSTKSKITVIINKFWSIIRYELLDIRLCLFILLWRESFY